MRNGLLEIDALLDSAPELSSFSGGDEFGLSAPTPVARTAPRFPGVAGVSPARPPARDPAQESCVDRRSGCCVVAPKASSSREPERTCGVTRQQFFSELTERQQFRTHGKAAVLFRTHGKAADQ